MRFLVGLCLGLAIAASPVAAAPTVEIKAQTQLTLGKVRLRPDGTAAIDGQLLDKLTGDGLAGQRISVRIGVHTIEATTGADGKFTATIETEPGTQQVALAFRGGGALDPAQLTVTTDPARSPVTLLVTEQEATDGVQLIVLASADDQPLRARIQLTIGPPAAPTLAPLTTVDAGAPYVLTRRAAGGTGLRHVHAAFTGDDAHQAAGADLTVELTSETTTTIAAASTSLAYEDDLVITGKVHDLEGHAVPLAAVTLTSGDRRLAQGATAEDGSYKLALEAQILGTGDLGIQVQTDPGGHSLRPSRSPPMMINVATPQPVPISYTVIAFVATALAAGGFFAARTKPWRRLARAAPATAAPAAGVVDSDRVDGGIVIAKPGLISTLRRPSDDGFDGVVCDTVRGRPIAGALLRITLATGARDVTTATDGAFALESLPAGDHGCEVIADGHVTEKFVATIPHRGELRGVRVQLVPVRERVFQLYRRAAEPVLPEPRLWGIWSPRQIVDHVRARRPSPALAELTDFVEEVYFSARVSAETVIPDASDRVDLAIRERIRVPHEFPPSAS